MVRNGVENFQLCFIAAETITIDEQFLPRKKRYKFIYDMGNALDKFWLKLWLSVDLDEIELDVS